MWLRTALYKIKCNNKRKSIESAAEEVQMLLSYSFKLQLSNLYVFNRLHFLAIIPLAEAGWEHPYFKGNFVICKAYNQIYWDSSSRGGFVFL